MVESSQDERLGRARHTQSQRHSAGGYRRAVLRIARIAVALLVGLALPSAIGVVGAGAGIHTNVSAVIARVIDGDTVALTNGTRVRLVQIDTPEVGGGECYSQAARKALLRLTRFARMLPQLLSQKQLPLARADLRYTNGFALSWTVAPPRAAAPQ